MEATDVKLQITRQDWVAFQFGQLIQGRDTRRRLMVWAFVPPAVLVGLGLLLTFRQDPGTLRAVGTWVSVFTLPAYLGLVYGVVRTRLERQVDASVKAGQFIGSTQISLSEEQVTVTRGSQSVSKSWKQISRVTANGDYGFLYLTPEDVVLIPRRCFSDPASFEMFVKSAILYQWHGENAKKAAAAAPAPAKAPEPTQIAPAIIPMMGRTRHSNVSV